MPTAFGDGGVAFGLGYLVVVITHSALYSQAHGRGVLWFALPNALSALSVTAAGLFDGAAALGLWGLALLFQFVTPAISRRATASGAEAAEGTTIEEQLGGIGAAHFVERHGLLLIIVFGESIIAVGIGVGSLPLTFGIIVGAFLTLAVGAALWWMYCVRDEGRAEHVFAGCRPGPPSRSRAGSPVIWPGTSPSRWCLGSGRYGSARSRWYPYWRPPRRACGSARSGS